MSEQPTGRHCSRQTCTRDAVCTLTYVYADSTAVIGVLSARSEPHAYDLCGFHADRMTAPRGWRVVRLDSSGGWDSGHHDKVSGAMEHSTGGSDAPTEQDRTAREGRGVLRDVSYQRSEDDSAHEVSHNGGTAASEAVPPWQSVPPPESMRRGHIRRP